MRIGILAANGQLGHELVRVLSAAHDVCAWRDAEVDITNPQAMAAAISGWRTEYVINAAAYTDVDGCENNPDRAWAVNAEAPGHLARLCEGTAIGLLHFSTDYVFDGTLRRPYREDDPTNPLQVYGKSKRAGELAVLANCPNALVIRTAWLYGAHGRNFVNTILSLASQRPGLEVVDDQRGTPTSAADLAALVPWLIAQRLGGLFHATNAGDCTWYELAVCILKLRGLKTPVAPVSSAAVHRPAQRPAYSVLDNSALLEGGAPSLRPWADALRAFLT